jgi:hypothetical protein
VNGRELGVFWARPSAGEGRAQPPANPDGSRGQEEVEQGEEHERQGDRDSSPGHDSVPQKLVSGQRGVGDDGRVAERELLSAGVLLWARRVRSEDAARPRGG